MNEPEASESYRTPCQRSETPDDWFIGRDGKQYGDDEFPSDPTSEDPARDAVDQKRAILQRRRHAREACYDCYLRTQCLDLALRNGEDTGTWGGYYEEELRKIRREIGRRKRKET